MNWTLSGSGFAILSANDGVAVDFNESLWEAGGFAGLYIDTDEIPVTTHEGNAALCMANLKASLQPQLAITLSEPGSYNQRIVNQARSEVIIVRLSNGHATVQLQIILNRQTKSFGMAPGALFTPDDITGIVDVTHAIDIFGGNLETNCEGSGQIPQEF